MASKFKPGDVIRYINTKLGERVGIVTDCPKQYLDTDWGPQPNKTWAYWRQDDGSWASNPKYVRHDNDPELHPDPDPLWADYCAAVLRGEAEPL